MSDASTGGTLAAPAAGANQPTDPSRRNWIAITYGVGAVGGGFTAVPFVSSFAPSERAKAMAAIRISGALPTMDSSPWCSLSQKRS